MRARALDARERYLSARETAALIASLFFVGMSFGGSSPLVSALLESRGFSEYFTGAVVAMLSLGLALFSPVAGRLVDALGPRPVNVAGILLQGVGFAGLGLSLLWDERALLLARLWLGIAAAMTFVAAEYALIRGTPPSYRGRIMAAYGTGFGLGFMLGVFAGNRAFHALGLVCFGLPSAVALLIAPLAYRGMGNIAVARDAAGPAVRAPDDALRWRPLLIALYGSVVYAVLDIAMTGTYPVEGQRLGLSRAQALDIIGWMAFGTVLIQPFAGWLADRFGNRRLLFSLAATGLAASWLAGHASFGGLAQSTRSATIAFFVVGCAVGGMFPVSLALLGDRTPAAHLSRANAAFSAAFGYASLVGPLVAAAFIDLAERWNLLGWAVPALAMATFSAAGPLLWLDRRWQRGYCCRR